MAKNLVFVTNMYPSSDKPSKGIFCKNIYNFLKKESSLETKLISLDERDGKFSKLLGYLVYYFKIMIARFLNSKSTFYTHYISHSTLPFILLSFMGVNTDLVVHVHGGDAKLLNGYNKLFFRIKKLIVQYSLNLARVIIVPSISYKNYILEEYVVNTEKLIIYPSGGVNIDVFYPNTYDNSKRLKIGYAGRLEKTKNVDTIVSAMKLLKGCSLSIVGTGREQKNLENIVNENCLDNVTISASLPQAELADWYRDLDILIYPSSSESLGLVPLEAMACGVYCILSNLPVFNELKQHNIVFHTLDSINSSDIAKAVIDISNSADQIRRARENNPKVIREIYNSQSVNKGLLNVFE